jgi:hypothetical protein
MTLFIRKKGTFHHKKRALFEKIGGGRHVLPVPRKNFVRNKLISTIAPPPPPLLHGYCTTTFIWTTNCGLFGFFSPLFARLMLNICPTFRLCNLFGGQLPPCPPGPYAYGHHCSIYVCILYISITLLILSYYMFQTIPQILFFATSP